MLPYDKHNGDKLSKKGKAKGKPIKKENSKESGEEEKDRKRRTSLTDSPLTSSSASTTSTLDSENEQKSSPSKSVEYQRSNDEKQDQGDLSKEVPGPSRVQTAPGDNHPDDEDKVKRKKHKKKKKKDASEAKENENSGDLDLEHGSKNQQQQSNDAKDELEHDKTTSDSSRSSHQAKSNDAKLSYSTASINTGTTTVTTTKMSFADGLTTDLFSTSSAISPLSSVYNNNKSTRKPNPYVHNESLPEENIDRVEVETAHKVMFEQNKKVQHYDSKWMNIFHMAVVEGDWDKFLKSINVIHNVLYTNRTPHLKKMTEAEFRNYVMMAIVEHFYDANENTTILMSLAATRDLTRTCEDVGHGYCKMISIILAYLIPAEINYLLLVKTKRTERTAIHFAATTGQICQLQALLRYDPNPDIIDKSGYAPIHHCIERNNLEMVKLLIKYGADPSLCPRDRFKHPPRMIALSRAHEHPMLGSWLQVRIDAINREFTKSVNECIGQYYQLIENLSDVHFIRASENYNYMNLKATPITKRAATLNIRADLANRCNQTKTFAALFFVPMFFQTVDEDSMSDVPHLYRTAFDLENTTNGQGYPFIPNQVILTGMNLQQAHILKSLVYPLHNGHFYAYELSPLLLEGQYKIEMHIDFERFRTSANRVIIVMGAFLCREIDEKTRKSREVAYSIPVFQPEKVKAKID